MRSFNFDKFGAAEIYQIVRANVAREARLITDEARVYVTLGREYAEHGTTHHKAKQYVDYKDRTIHFNTGEGAFSIFKGGMKGVYQCCSEQHLHRYLAEFEFRYNNRAALGCNDADRSNAALKGIAASGSPTQGLTATPKRPRQLWLPRLEPRRRSRWRPRRLERRVRCGELASKRLVFGFTLVGQKGCERLKLLEERFEFLR